MKQQQQGFTLIELVMVIVILGVLAAVALPKFVDLKSDAQKAATQGVAGGMASASAINYGACSVYNHNPASSGGKCVKVSKCSEAGALLQPAMTIGTTCTSGSNVPPYLTADTAVGTNGATATCELNFGTGSTCVSGGTATFTVIGAGN